MTDTARDHLERAVAWLDTPGFPAIPDSAFGRALAEVKHALELLAIPPRDPTTKMMAAGFVVPEAEHDPAAVWRAMYDAALAEKEGK